MAVVLTSQKKIDLEIARRATEICDQIILEMGAELHDDLIQKLSIFRLYLDRLERSADNPAETEALLINMRADFEGVIQSVRRISRKLLPEFTNQESLNVSVELLCKSMERPGFGNIFCEASGVEGKISKQSLSYLYRIIQELIHNAFKHSAAWHIWVRINWQPEKLIIEVEDDGSGFNKISEFIDRLRRKNNTLRLRSQVIGAVVTYHHGKKGLLAKITYDLS
ncbi:MAG TPA: ATP-binding protein [Chryseolinea sp.]